MLNDWSRLKKISKKYDTVTGMMSYVNEATLREAFREQPRKKAKGIDGVSKADYEENLNENINDLMKRLKTFAYHPQPVRRVYIPKENGKMRPLGIPSFEDKLVQSAMAKALYSVYEPRFLDCSYGFRRTKDAHKCIADINHTLMFKKINYVLEADIKGFFDNVVHDQLIEFLEKDIKDEKFIRYVRRFLRAGIMEDGKRYESDKNVPQGGVISPTLANVYLHYVLDTWFEEMVKPKMDGQAYYFRFADDFTILFQKERDAMRVLEVLKKRLAKYGLELAMDKTKILPFGRFKGTKESFDFLGFRFINGKDRKGKYRVHIRTSKKKLKVKRQAVKDWLWENMHAPMVDTLKRLRVKLLGHVNYYGVNGNFASIKGFYNYAKYMYYKMLRRRGQKNPISYEAFDQMWDALIPEPPRIRATIWY